MVREQSKPSWSPKYRKCKEKGRGANNNWKEKTGEKVHGAEKTWKLKGRGTVPFIKSTTCSTENGKENLVDEGKTETEIVYSLVGKINFKMFEGTPKTGPKKKVVQGRSVPG